MARTAAPVEDEEEELFWQEGDIDDAIAGKSEVSFSSIPFWSPTPSDSHTKWRKNYIRILPPRADHQDFSGNPSSRFYLWEAIHYLRASKRYVLCPDRNFNEDGTCPICNEGRRLADAGLKDDARDFWPTWRALVNVLELNSDGSLKVEDDASDPVVKVWSMPKSLAEALLDTLPDFPKEFQNIASPNVGRNLIVKAKKKDATKNSFVEFSWPDEFPEPSKLPQEGIALLKAGAMHALYEIHPKLELPKIVALLAGPEKQADPFDTGDDEEDDEDEVIQGEVRELPAPKAEKAPKAAPAAAPADDDDEEEEAAAPSAPAPKKGAATDPAVEEARKRLQASLEEDDEDEEDE